MCLLILQEDKKQYQLDAELKKIKVVSPNLTIYIGEAQAGQAIVDQVLGFDKR